MPGASGYEWSRVEDQLAQEHTVYTLDLLGCGRSEKAGITYTNFLFVQIICDFIKNVIKEKTDIIASGFSCSFVTTAAAYDKESINKIMFINPVSMISLAQTTTKKDKLFKFFIELPIFGTFIYHIIVSRETINDFFLDKLYYNPFHVDKDVLDAYYEAAHKGGYYAKCLYSSQSAKYMNINIRHAVESIDNSIYIVEGEDEPNGAAIVEAYQKVNPAIESATIPCSKHFPHIENVEAFLEEFGLLHIENLKWFRDVDFNPLEAIGINLDAEYFENLLDEYDINTTTYPLGMCCTNELFLVMTITNEFYCFTNGCCELCGIGVEDMLDCLIGECRISKTIE